jgi:hypothetical protein
MSKDRNIWIFGCFLFTGSIISLLYQMVLLFMVLERETTRFELEILRRKIWTCSKVWHAFYKTGIVLLASSKYKSAHYPKDDITTFETARWNSAAFLHIFVMKSGARTIKHIYFVSLNIYIHSSILTYLLIFISSSLS